MQIPTNSLKTSSNYNRVIGHLDKYPIVSLFPYQIKNVNLFIHRDHPPYDKENPQHRAYYRTVWKRIVEGLWVEDKDETGSTWVFMMPKLFGYTNCGTIGVEDDSGQRFDSFPECRDNEWIKGSYTLCFDGFSGFIDDPDFTCHVDVERIENGEELTPYELNALKEQSVFKEDGTFKKYINAWDYLTVFYLLENPRPFPLGKPLYWNGSYNGMHLASRKEGKSYWMGAGDCVHEFNTNGVREVKYLDRRKRKSKISIFVGAADKKPLESFMGFAELSWRNVPGRSKNYSSPLFRDATGVWNAERAQIIQGYRPKGSTETFGSGSEISNAIILPNKAEIVVSRRSRRIYVDEVGLVKNIIAVYDAAEGTLRATGKQSGSLVMGGCVCKGTKVWKNTGELVNIEDLRQEDGILGYDSVSNKVLTQTVSYIQPPVSKPCYRITTEYGRVLECSDDHPIAVRKFRSPNSKNSKNSIVLKPTVQWTRADNIKAGEGIGVVDKTDVWPNRRMFDPRLIGWLIGDGTYGNNALTYKLADGSVAKSKGGMAALMNADPEVWKHIDERYVTRTDVANTPTADGRMLRKSRILGLVPALTELGIRGQTKLNKRLPSDIYSYCKQDICELIGGYYDADGCVYFDERTKYCAIKITSISKELIYGLKDLLEKLGIHGKVQVEAPRVSKLAIGKYETHNLYVKDGRSIIEFYRNIRLVIKHKQEKLEKCYKHKSSIRDKRSRSGFRLEKVYKVEFIGEQPVYNLTAEGTNTYIANGVHTHNTGGNITAIQETKQIATDPIRFHVYPVPNYWKDNRPFCLFTPVTYTEKKYKDKNGNTDLIAATKGVLSDRFKQSGGDLSKLTKHRQNFPIIPDEMFLAGKSDYFSKDIIIDRIQILEDGLWQKQTKLYDLKLGDKKRDGSFEVTATQHYRYDNVIRTIFASDIGDRTGELCVFEEPKENLTDFAQEEGLYKVILDPITDKYTGRSYVGIIVYKGYPQRDLEPGEIVNNIVASFKARRDDIDNNEMAMLLALWYRCKVQYENNVNGIGAHFDKLSLGGLIQPPPYGIIKEHVPGTTQGKDRGVTMTGDLKPQLMRAFKRHHIQTVRRDDNGREFSWVEDCYDLALLYEMNFYDEDTNVDLISAMLILMIWLEQERKVEVPGGVKASESFKELAEMAESYYDW